MLEEDEAKTGHWGSAMNMELRLYMLVYLLWTIGKSSSQGITDFDF